MEWQPLKTAPRDGTQVLLASVDDGGYGVRQGFYEGALYDRCWYDIDGERVEPQYWMPLPPAPPLPNGHQPPQGEQ